MHEIFGNAYMMHEILSFEKMYLCMHETFSF